MLGIRKTATKVSLRDFWRWTEKQFKIVNTILTQTAHYIVNGYWLMSGLSFAAAD